MLNEIIKMINEKAENGDITLVEADEYINYLYELLDKANSYDYEESEERI